MTNSEQNSRYVRQANIVARRVGGETLLVPTTSKSVNAGSRTAQLYVLNETGERLWHWLGSPNTEADLARNLMSEFRVTEETAHKDAQAFVRELEHAGLVVRTRNEG